MTDQPPPAVRGAALADDLAAGADSSHPASSSIDTRQATGMPEDLVVESRSAGDPGAEDSGRPIILNPPNNATLDSRAVTFSGTGAPSGRILIRHWLVPVAECTADDNGNWTAAITNLSSGTHVFVAERSDDDRSPLTTSEAWTIHVPSQKELDAIAARQKKWDRHGIRRLLHRKHPENEAAATAGAPQTDGPEVQDKIPDEPADPDPPIALDPGIPCILYPENDSHVGSTLTLFGTAAANSIIAVLDEDDLVGLAESDDTGHWTATVKSLSPGTHQLHACGSADGVAWRLVSPSVTVVSGDPAL